MAGQLHIHGTHSRMRVGTSLTNGHGVVQCTNQISFLDDVSENVRSSETKSRESPRFRDGLSGVVNLAFFQASSIARYGKDETQGR